MGLSVQPVVSWLQDAGRVIDYGVRFTKPVLVPAEGTSVLSVIATIGQVDAENQKARVDLTTSFGELTVLGKAQVWVQF
jgi:acyl dehydratase